MKNNGTRVKLESYEMPRDLADEIDRLADRVERQGEVIEALILRARTTSACLFLTALALAALWLSLLERGLL